MRNTQVTHQEAVQYLVTPVERIGPPGAPRARIWDFAGAYLQVGAWISQTLGGYKGGGSVGVRAFAVDRAVGVGRSGGRPAAAVARRPGWTRPVGGVVDLQGGVRDA